MFENVPQQSFDPRKNRTAPLNPASNGNDFSVPPLQGSPTAPVAQPQNIISQQVSEQMQEGTHVLDIDTHESATNRRNIIMVVGVLLIVLIGLTLGGFYVVQQLASDNGASTNTALPVNGSASNRNTNTNNAVTNSALTNTSPVRNSNVTAQPAATPTGPCIFANQVVTDSSADTDSDGLLDGQESAFGTSIYLADTDSDSYFDGQEVSGGFNPCGAGQL